MNLIWPRRAQNRIGASPLLLVLLAGIAFSTRSARGLPYLPADDTTYTLQRQYKLGEVDRYSMSIHTLVNSPGTQGTNVEVTFAMRMKETTKEVMPDGSATLVSEFEAVTANVGGKESDLTRLLPQLTRKRDKTWRVLETSTAGGNAEFNDGGNEQIFSTAQAAFYAPKPVKVGDSWKVDVGSNRTKIPGPRMTGNAKALSVEMVGAVKTLKIRVTADVALNDAMNSKLRFDGTGNLDLTTGKLVRMVGTTEGNAGSLGKNKADLSLALLPDMTKTDIGKGSSLK